MAVTLYIVLIQLQCVLFLRWILAVPPTIHDRLRCRRVLCLELRACAASFCVEFVLLLLLSLVVLVAAALNSLTLTADDF